MQKSCKSIIGAHEKEASNLCGTVFDIHTGEVNEGSEPHGPGDNTWYTKQFSIKAIGKMESDLW